MFAADKKFKKEDEKQERPLELEHFQKIYKAAPHFLKVAMALSFQTTHTVQEMHKVRYSDCDYFDEPQVDSETGLLIYGYMRIHRLKVEKKRASKSSSLAMRN